jgi:hypothetical protein
MENLAGIRPHSISPTTVVPVIALVPIFNSIVHHQQHKCYPESTKNYLENLVGWHYFQNHYLRLAVVITSRIRDEILAKYRAVPLGARLMATSLSVGTSSVAVTAAFIFRYCSFEVVSVACCANRLGCIAAKKQE